MTSSNIETSSSGTLRDGMPQRYDLVLRSRGMECFQEMEKVDDGEWVRYGEMTAALAYVTGYLEMHIGVLESQGAHPTIVGAVQNLITEINSL